MKPLEILAAVLDTSQRMLSLARAGDWDGFIQQEQLRQEAITTLQKLGLGQKPGLLSDQAHANALITKILALDGELQALVSTQMADLSERFSSAGVSRQLANAYLQL